MFAKCVFLISVFDMFLNMMKGATTMTGHSVCIKYGFHDAEEQVAGFEITVSWPSQELSQWPES